MHYPTLHKINKKIVICAFLVLIISLIAIGPGASQAAAKSIPAAGAANTIQLSPAEFLNRNGTLNTATLSQSSFNLTGWNVTLDAQLGAVFSQAAGNS